MKGRYLQPFLTAAAGGVYLSLMYVNPYSGRITLSELILQLSGSRGRFALGFSLSEMVSFAMCLFPAFIFEMYAGIMLYRHFCTASVYVFSRYPHRVKWYVREICHLGGMTCIFQVLLLMATILTAVIRCELQIDRAGIVLMVYHFLIHSLWIYIMALLANLLAVFLGSSTAYMIVVSAQLACIVLLSLMELLVQNFDGRLSYENILLWDPAAHLVLGWHSGNVEMIDQALVSSYMQTDLKCSVILFLSLGMILTFAGAFIIKKHDLLINDAETGAA